MCSAAGLEESSEVPDILLSEKGLRRAPQTARKRKNEMRRIKKRRVAIRKSTARLKKRGRRRKKVAATRRDLEALDQMLCKQLRLVERESKETRVLHEFSPDRLARHVLARVKNPADTGDLKLLERTFKGLQRESDVELHIRDDQVCSKAFKRPATLPTDTSLEAYTWLMLSDLDRWDRVYISSENGEWLLREPIRTLLRKQTKLHLLLAFSDEEEALVEAFGSSVRTAVIDPWRHNRHMTIVCDGKSPRRAIYFARRLRTPVITAVYLESIRDVQRLTKMFWQRWEEAKAEERAQSRQSR